MKEKETQHKYLFDAIHADSTCTCICNYKLRLINSLAHTHMVLHHGNIIMREERERENIKKMK